MMAPKSKILSREEFELLTVGNTCVVREPPAVIRTEHSARLIEFGYIVDLAARLRMTTTGRQRIAAGFENRQVPISNLATEQIVALRPYRMSTLGPNSERGPCVS